MKLSRLLLAMVGAGLVAAPMGCFQQAFEALKAL